MPAEIWAAEKGFIWRRSQDLQVLAEALRLMPRFSGKPEEVTTLAMILSQGLVGDVGERARARALRHIDDFVGAAVREPLPSQDGD